VLYPATAERRSEGARPYIRSGGPEGGGRAPSLATERRATVASLATERARRVSVLGCLPELRAFVALLLAWAACVGLLHGQKTEDMLPCYMGHY